MNAHPTPQHTIEIVSDTICPWCYVGLTRFQSARDQLSSSGASFVVRHVPFQLNPDMPNEGLDRKVYRSRKFGSWERSLALDAQVEDAARQDGLAMNHELMARTPNTLASHVLIHLAEEQGVQDAVVEAVFRAYFTEGRDIGSLEVLAQIGRQAGVRRADLEQALADPVLRAAVAGEADRVSRDGVASVPTFFLDGALLFSGAQPASVIAALLEEQLAGGAPKEADS